MAKAKQGKKPAMSKAERLAWEKQAQVNAANIKLAADASACARDDYSAICKAENTAKVRFERIILSGRNYASEELHEQGVVDILAEPGRGEHELRALVGGIANKPGIPAFRRAVRKYQAIDKHEIRAIADEWVSTALKLSEEHLRRIEKLRSAQSKLGLAPAPTPTIRYVAKAQAGHRAPRFPL